jgi:hypothetical protein
MTHPGISEFIQNHKDLIIGVFTGAVLPSIGIYFTYQLSEIRLLFVEKWKAMKNEYGLSDNNFEEIKEDLLRRKIYGGVNYQLGELNQKLSRRVAEVTFSRCGVGRRIDMLLQAFQPRFEQFHSSLQQLTWESITVVGGTLNYFSEREFRQRYGIDSQDELEKKRDDLFQLTRSAISEMVPIFTEIDELVNSTSFEFAFKNLLWCVKLALRRLSRRRNRR